MAATPGKAAGGVAAAILAVMLAVLAWAIAAGDFRGEGRLLLHMPWGIMTLVDLYAGLTLVGCWIALTERAWLPVAGWVLALVFLGNIASLLFVLHRARAARGDWRQFWTGGKELN